MRAALYLGPGLVLLAGCVPLQLIDPTVKDETKLVTTNPFGVAGAVSLAPPKLPQQPPDERIALRVHETGNRLLTANPDIALQPVFLTYGTPTPELFHTSFSLGNIPPEVRKKVKHDGRAVHITEGLVQKCKTDEELAALLSHELAQMVVERELLASPAMRRPEERPPVQVAIGNGVSPGEIDVVRQAELGRFEQRRLATAHQPTPLPDADKLARRYLEKAGYSPTALDAIAPLLREAGDHFVIEKQYRQVSGHAAWTAAPK